METRDSGGSFLWDCIKVGAGMLIGGAAVVAASKLLDDDGSIVEDTVEVITDESFKIFD